MNNPLLAKIQEEKEEARLAFKRKVLEERARRIHKPLATSIALDVTALDDQIKEKRHQQIQESKINEKYEQLIQKYDNILIEQDRKEDEAKKAYIEDLKRFWREEQPKEKTREWNLNCKEYLTDSLYELKFVGEDENWQQRKNIQKEETRQILQEQMQEEILRKRAEERNKKEEMEAVQELQRRALHLDELENLCRLAEKKTVEKINMELTEERRRAESELEAMEEKAIQEHIDHVKNSTLLTEDERAARSALGPHRVLCDRWKGMNEEEKSKYRKDLLSQIEENKKRKMEEQKLEECFGDQLNILEKKGLYLLRKEKEKSTSDAFSQMEENLVLAERQKQQNQKHENICNVNYIDDVFFNKFGIYPR